MSFTVDTTGRVHEVKVDKGTRSVINRAVRRGIEQSRFAPGQLNGHPVNVRLRVKVVIEHDGWAITEVLPGVPLSFIKALKRLPRRADSTEPADPTREKEADLNLQAARYYMRRGEWEKALARLLTVYSQYPQYSRSRVARRWIGDVLVELDQSELATQFYRLVGEQRRTGSDGIPSPPTKAPAPSAMAGRESDSASPPAEPEVITLESTLVNVPVTVRDHRGAYVIDLRRNEFTVFENKVKQRIAFFARAEEPLMVALLLDTSGSTVEELHRIQDAATAFVEQLRDRDRLLVVSFSQVIRQENEPTSDRRLIGRAIRRASSSGTTRLYDALFHTLLHIQGQSEARRAVVLLTDGVDTASKVVGSDDVFKLAEESGIPIYSIRYDTLETAKEQARKQHGAAAEMIIENLEGAYELGNEFLHRLAEVTGGTLYQAASLKDLPRTLALLARELRHLYNLGYYPNRLNPGGEYRRIRVKVKRRGVRVQSRKGYEVPREPFPKVDHRTNQTSSSGGAVPGNMTTHSNIFL